MTMTMTMTSSVLALGVFATPAIARACGDNPCEPDGGPPLSVDLRSTLIPSDGVLRIDVVGGTKEHDWQLDVAVTDAYGVAVDGALTSRPGFDVLIWRPTEPWQPGAWYSVFLDVVVGEVEDVYADCERVQAAIQFKIGNSLPPPIAPRYEYREAYSLHAIGGLDSLVCCDGALPVWGEPSSESYGCPQDPGVSWGIGACSPDKQQGRLAVTYAMQDQDENLVLDNLAARLVTESGVYPGVRGDPFVATAYSYGPMCVRFEILDLGRDEVYWVEQCHGEELADQLGELPLDQSAELDAMCEGPLYRCESEFDGWSPDACVTWPNGDPYVHPRAATDAGSEHDAEPEDVDVSQSSSGCGPARAPTGGLGLVLLLACERALRRRRQRR